MLYDIVVVGAGAAGLGAARRLRFAPCRSLVVDARSRPGGRAHTVQMEDLILDLGCEWLHSADSNPLSLLAKDLGFTIDPTPARWGEQAGNRSFPPEDQRAFHAALQALEERIEEAARAGREGPAAAYFEPGSRWTPLIEAFSSYYNGASFEEVSVLDYAAYHDSGVNWRISEGLGAMICALGTGCDVRLGCEVSTIDHTGATLRLETNTGTLEARSCVITVPSPALARDQLRFRPALPEKRDAAAGLPLGLADKLFLKVEDPGVVPKDAHVLGKAHDSATGSYQLQPSGQPFVECFFGGAAADALETRNAFVDFALDELSALYGSAIRQSLRPLAATFWRADPYAGGSYSHALPGRRDDRLKLAEPVDQRLFFAGEACSLHSFSTAHGAYETGVLAAEAAMAALSRS